MRELIFDLSALNSQWKALPLPIPLNWPLARPRYEHGTGA